MRVMEHRRSRIAPRVAAIRGAVQVPADTPEQIARATVTLLEKMVTDNRLKRADLISLMFTMTPDLRSELPPLAARAAGWSDVPMLCAAELPTSMMIPRVIRVLAHTDWHTRRYRPRHIYLAGTAPTRPDLIDMPEAVRQASADDFSECENRRNP